MKYASQSTLNDCGCLGESPGACQARRFGHSVLHIIFAIIHQKVSFLTSITSSATMIAPPSFVVSPRIFLRQSVRGRHSTVLPICATYVMRPANAAFTWLLARKAPSTTTESIVARASSGETSSAILARPSTLICSFSPAALTASRS